MACLYCESHLLSSGSLSFEPKLTLKEPLSIILFSQHPHIQQRKASKYYYFLSSTEGDDDYDPKERAVADPSCHFMTDCDIDIQVIAEFCVEHGIVMMLDLR